VASASDNLIRPSAEFVPSHLSIYIQGLTKTGQPFCARVKKADVSRRRLRSLSTMAGRPGPVRRALGTGRRAGRAPLAGASLSCPGLQLQAKEVTPCNHHPVTPRCVRTARPNRISAAARRRSLVPPAEKPPHTGRARRGADATAAARQDGLSAGRHAAAAPCLFLVGNGLRGRPDSHAI
jgi:hypothetical protein